MTFFRVLRRALVGLRGVLFLIDLFAGVVLLAVDLLTLLRRESTAVGGAFIVHLAVDVGFAVFEMRGFAGIQAPRSDAVGMRACWL